MPLQYRAAVLHAAQTPLSIETVTAAALKPTDRAGADSRRRPLPYRSRSDRRLAALSDADRARARGRRRRRAGRPGSARREGRRPCRAVVESALRALLLLRPRCADPVRGISRQGAARRWRSTATAAATLADGRALQQLMFLGSFGEYCIVPDQQAIAGAEGNSVRPRLPDRLRRHDRRRRRAQSRRDRAWRQRDGDRLRRGRARGGAGRAAGRRRHDHRGRSRSGKTGAGRPDGRDPWRRCLKGRRRRDWQSGRPPAAASMS